MAVNLQTLLRGSKDAALALGVRGYFNTKFSRIGQMSELSVDTRKRAVRVRMELAGESKPIEIHVKKYDLERRRGRATVTVLDASASREWLTEVLRAFVIGRKFTIPDRAAAVLKLLT
jgi:Mg-chelatase subunit ChlD